MKLTSEAPGTAGASNSEPAPQEAAAAEFVRQRALISIAPKDARLMTKDVSRPLRLRIRVENRQTWILTDRLTGKDVGGVTYQHSNHGDHYQPWLLVDDAHIKIGMPVSQLDQAAQEIEGEILKRTEISAKRD